MSAEKWCWMYEDSESCEGPFDSREAALSDAWENVRDVAPMAPHREPSFKRRIVLGIARDVKPEDYVNVIDLDWLLERMDENDELGCFENEVIAVRCSCPDKTKHDCSRRAELALTEHLKAWAREWLESSSFIMDERETLALTLHACSLCSGSGDGYDLGGKGGRGVAACDVCSGSGWEKEETR